MSLRMGIVKVMPLSIATRHTMPSDALFGVRAKRQKQRQTGVHSQGRGGKKIEGGRKTLDVDRERGRYVEV